MKKTFSILALILVVLLFACSCLPENDENKAMDKMSKAGYNVSVDKTSIPALIYAETGKNPSFLLTAEKTEGDNNESIFAFSFLNDSDAKQATSYIKTWASRKLSSAEVVQKDAWVYFGTDGAVKAFTK